ncbi:ATP-binding protein [Streptomyces sp. NPDC001255]|uniref:ATP-binding protein n=1 Tax=Streptomyces sp. NPDC001255 TaxID=3364550 RepID=UPI0036AFDEC0
MTTLFLLAVLVVLVSASLLIIRARYGREVRRARAEAEATSGQLRAAETAVAGLTRLLPTGPVLPEDFVPPQLRDTPLATALRQLLAGVANAIGFRVEAVRQDARERVEQVKAIAEREQYEHVRAVLCAVATDLAHRAHGAPTPGALPPQEEPLVAEALRARRAAGVLLAAVHYATLVSPPPPGAPTPLREVFESASVRAAVAERVRLLQVPDVVVHGEAAEALTQILAALLDNATRVAVDVQVACEHQSDGTLALLVDDAGPGIPPLQLAAAQALLGEAGPDVLLRLGARPKLGLRAVGALARHLGLGVTLISPTPWGGTRVALAVPAALLGPRELGHLARPRGTVGHGAGARGTAQEWIAGTRRARTQEGRR